MAQDMAMTSRMGTDLVTTITTVQLTTAACGGRTFMCSAITTTSGLSIILSTAGLRAGTKAEDFAVRDFTEEGFMGAVVTAAAGFTEGRLATVRSAMNDNSRSLNEL